MRGQNKLLLAALIAVALLLFGAWSTPFVVASSVRLWLWSKSRQQGLAVRVDKVAAPLFRPVVLRGLHITSAPGARLQLEIDAPVLTVGLNLKSILLRRGSPPVPKVSGSALHVVIRENAAPSAQSNLAVWSALSELVPDSFSFEHTELRVERGSTVVLLRNLTLSANEIEAGQFAADQLVVSSPWMRQTFGQLRGATKWEERRLTIAGVTLTRGVDLPALTFDLSQLARTAVALQVEAEVFGGTLRLDISREDTSEGASWKLVGAVSDVSLAQAPPALGFSGAVGGIIHACKFTLRGRLGDLTDTTGWIWTELRDLKWKEGAAELLMIGAALYNGQIDVDQVYLKQTRNEVTLSGGAKIPRSSREWRGSNFRLNVAASIHDLSELAGLLGANVGDYAGELSINANVSARARRFTGELEVDGSSLRLQRKPVDVLRATAAFSDRQLQLTELVLKHGDDFVRGHGSFDLVDLRAVEGSVQVALANTADYFRRPGVEALELGIDFRGATASIEALKLRTPAGEVEFNGTVDLTRLRSARVTLLPTKLLRLGLFPESGCIAGVQFARTEDADELRGAVERIDLRREPQNGTWSFWFESEAGPSRTARVCRAGRGQRLQLFVSDRRDDVFDKALRVFHGAIGDPLNLLPSD